MMNVSQNTNETNGPHKRLYTVISVVEHGSWVQNLGCFKSYVIVNNQLFSQFDYILGLMSHQKVRSYGNGTLVYLGKFNIPRLHLPGLSCKKLDHDQTSDPKFTRLAT